MGLKKLFKKVKKVLKKIAPVAIGVVGGYLLGTTIIPKFFGKSSGTTERVEAPSPQPQPSYWGEIGGAVGSVVGGITTGYVSSLARPETMQSQPPAQPVLVYGGETYQPTTGGGFGGGGFTIGGDGEVTGLESFLRPPLLYIILGVFGLIIVLVFTGRKK